MEQIADRSLAYLIGLFHKASGRSASKLPACGVSSGAAVFKPALISYEQVHAFLEAKQQPLSHTKRALAPCDLQELCHNEELLLRYIFSLSTYCRHSSLKDFTDGVPDYECTFPRTFRLASCTRN
jgi:hypothetical protein